MGLLEDGAAKRPAADYLGVRIQERRGRRLRLLAGWLSALVGTPDETPDVPSGAGVAIVVYRLPHGEALARMDYDGWARYLAGRHADALERRPAGESLSNFCESMGIDLGAALGPGQ